MYDGVHPQPKVLTVDTVDDDGIRALIEGILFCAVSDIQKGPGRSNHGYAVHRTRNYNSAVAFLKSEWFYFMTDVDGKKLLKILQERSGNGELRQIHSYTGKKEKRHNPSSTSERRVGDSRQRILQDLRERL